MIFMPLPSERYTNDWAFEWLFAVLANFYFGANNWEIPFSRNHQREYTFYAPGGSAIMYTDKILKSVHIKVTVFTTIDL